MSSITSGQSPLSHFCHHYYDYFRSLAYKLTHGRRRRMDRLNWKGKELLYANYRAIFSSLQAITKETRSINLKTPKLQRVAKTLMGLFILWNCFEFFKDNYFFWNYSVSGPNFLQIAEIVRVFCCLEFILIAKLAQRMKGIC